MRKQQLQLLLLGFSPTLLVVLLSLVLLYRRPNAIDLMIAVIATILTLACNISLKRSLDVQLLEPL